MKKHFASAPHQTNSRFQSSLERTEYEHKNKDKRHLWSRLRIGQKIAYLILVGCIAIAFYYRFKHLAGTI